MSSPQPTLRHSIQTFSDLAAPYADTGFCREILPVIPPTAAISTASRVPTAIAEGRGKLPGKRLHDGWVGFGGWAQHKTTPEDVANWSEWPCGVGLQGRNHPGLDIDADDGEVAQALDDLAADVLGAAPSRSTGSARLLRVYNGQGHRKRRLAFTLPGQTQIQAVELLGEGQFYVVEGPHKSGRMYQWQGGTSPAHLGADRLTEINGAKLNEYFDKAETLLKQRFDAVITSRPERAARTVPGPKVLSAAPSLEALQACVAAIPNDASVTYDEWIKVGLAMHAASEGSEEGYGLFEEWSLQWGGDNTPDVVRDKWASFRPEATGWNILARMARKNGFNAAAWEFAANGASPADREAALDAMFADSVWVERVQLVLDLPSGDRLPEKIFSGRYWQVGPPTSSSQSAFAEFLAQGNRRRTVKSVTYRPGGERFVYEASENGECINLWRPTAAAIPDYATMADVQPWLDHLAFLFPDDGDRAKLMNWLAWVVQRPDQKPNWGVLIGSQHQGNGKSIILAPVRAALGDANVCEVTPDELASGYTDWLEQTKLFVVEEMHSFERASHMNRLKNFLALPPHRLRVNPKYGKQYEVPNILAGVFFTNHRDALALEKSDRRFCVLWTDAAPKEQAYYTELVRWYAAGGAAATARYLLDLDLGDFDAQGRAPETTAKVEMRNQSRSRLAEWLEDGLAEGAELGTGVFGADLVALEDLRKAIPDEVYGKQPPSPQRFRAALLSAGATDLKERVNLGAAPPGVIPPRCDLEQVRLYALRNAKAYADIPRGQLTASFWAERLRAQGGPVDPSHVFVLR